MLQHGKRVFQPPPPPYLSKFFLSLHLMPCKTGDGKGMGRVWQLCAAANGEQAVNEDYTFYCIKKLK